MNREAKKEIRTLLLKSRQMGMTGSVVLDLYCALGLLPRDALSGPYLVKIDVENVP